jgi:hypothetical protein
MRTVASKSKNVGMANINVSRSSFLGAFGMACDAKEQAVREGGRSATWMRSSDHLLSK